jgi:hypothetical protein
MDVFLYGVQRLGKLRPRRNVDNPIIRPISLSALRQISVTLFRQTMVATVSFRLRISVTSACLRPCTFVRMARTSLESRVVRTAAVSAASRTRARPCACYLPREYDVPEQVESSRRRPFMIADGHLWGGPLCQCGGNALRHARTRPHGIGLFCKEVSSSQRRRSAASGR